MGIVIRPMQTADLDRVMALEEERQRHPWPRVSFEQALRTQQYCIVAEEETPSIGGVASTIVGYAVGDLRNGRSRTICSTTPIAAIKLYNAWFDMATASGLREISAEIESSNTSAKQMLEHYGFGYVGTRPHFYGVDRPSETYVKKLT